jgi:hypothetical protein
MQNSPRLTSPIVTIHVHKTSFKASPYNIHTRYDGSNCRYFSYKAINVKIKQQWRGGGIFYKGTTSDDQLGNKHTMTTKKISEKL